MNFTHLGCGGREHDFGQNSAFALGPSHGTNTNMFLYDVNPTATRVMRDLAILKKANVKRIILAVSHMHGDHFSRKAFEHLELLCKENRVKLGIMRSGFSKHDNEVLRSANQWRLDRKRPITIYSKSEVADMLRQKKIETQEIQHNRFERYNYADKSKHFMHCIGVRLYDAYGRFTAYGTDHCDRDYVRNIMEDPNLNRFYTDANDKPKDISDSHMSLEELDLLVNPYKRSKVTCVHMPYSANKMARQMGFNTAVPTMAVLDPRFVPPPPPPRKDKKRKGNICLNILGRCVVLACAL